MDNEKMEKELVRAVKQGDAALVQSLLMKGANPEARDEKGDCVLSLAIREGSRPMVRALRDHGANPLSHDASGRHAISEAALSSSPEVLDEVLVARRHDRFSRLALLSEPDESGFPALHLAVARNDLAMVSHLVSRGANLHMRDGAGETALESSLRLSSAPVVMVLLEADSSAIPARSEAILPLVGARPDAQSLLNELAEWAERRAQPAFKNVFEKSSLLLDTPNSRILPKPRPPWLETPSSASR